MEVIYRAVDGTEFTSEDACSSYENKFAKHLDYFRILYNPDLCETGQFQNKLYVAVYNELPYATSRELVEQYAITQIGTPLMRGVQGYGICSRYIIADVEKEEFDRCEKVRWCNGSSKQVLLSQKYIPGFDDIENYMDFIK